MLRFPGCEDALVPRGTFVFGILTSEDLTPTQRNAGGQTVTVAGGGTH